MSRAPTMSINPAGKDFRIFNQMGPFLLKFQIGGKTIHDILKPELKLSEKFTIERFPFCGDDTFTYSVDEETSNVLQSKVFKPLFSATKVDKNINLTPTPILENINAAMYQVSIAQLTNGDQAFVNPDQTTVNITENDGGFEAKLQLAITVNHFTGIPNNPIKTDTTKKEFIIDNGTSKDALIKEISKFRDQCLNQTVMMAAENLKNCQQGGGAAAGTGEEKGDGHSQVTASSNGGDAASTSQQAQSPTPSSNNTAGFAASLRARRQMNSVNLGCKNPCNIM
jgi:hypothetical protein